jgi:hypothetical protein
MRQKILIWGMGFFWYHIETIFMFQTFSFIMINKTFTFKLFCFASNMWVSANITIHNVVIGIINEPQKLWLRDILEFTLFSLREYDTVGIANWFFHENSWFGQFLAMYMFIIFERNYHRKLLQKTGCNYLLPFWNCDIFFTAIKICILKICRKMVEIWS